MSNKQYIDAERKARLIAAAPTLAEELRQLIELVETHLPDSDLAPLWCAGGKIILARVNGENVAAVEAEVAKARAAMEEGAA